MDASTNNWQLKNLENRHELLEKEKKRLKKLNSNQSNIKKHASLNSLKLNDPVETLGIVQNNQKNKETEIENLNRQRSSSTSYLNELDDYGDHRKLSDNMREENLLENESKLKKQNSICKTIINSEKETWS